MAEYEFSSLIGGQWSAAAGATCETRNPARPSEVVGRYTASSPADIAEACSVAAAAQRQWTKTATLDRLALVERFLAAEVVGDCREIDAGTAGDQARAGAVEAQFAEHVERSIDELRAGLGAAVAGCGRCAAPRAGFRCASPRRKRRTAAACSARCVGHCLRAIQSDR